MTFTLRDYQEKAVKKAVWSMQLQGNELLVLATGAGKSIIIAETVNRIGQHTLILQPNKEIMTQNIAKLKPYVKEWEIGIYSASMNSKTVREYTFATIGSIYKRPELFAHFGLFIIDEVHQQNPKNLGSMFTMFINKVNHLRGSQGLLPVKIIGLTATPYRNVIGYHTDEQGNLYASVTLKLINRMKADAKTPCLWDRVLINVGIGDLIEQGYLCPLRYENRSFLTHEEMKLNKSGTEFDLDDFSVKLGIKQQQVVECVLDAQKRFKRVLVFCPSVSVANKYASVVEGSKAISAKTDPKERDRIGRDFLIGKLQTVFNMGVYCLDAETEILTDRGFVNKDNFDLERDRVANWDQGHIWFSHALGYIQRDRFPDERMVYLNTRNRSVRVTEDHRMLWKKSLAPVPFEIMIAKDVVGRMGYLPISGQAEPERYDVQDSRYPYKQPHELSLDECRLIGFWLGDGSKYHPKKGGIRYTLAQSKVYPNIVNYVDNLLSRLGLDFIKRNKPDQFSWELPRGTGKGYQKRNGIISIEPYLDKQGSALLRGLSAIQFDAFIEGLWYADGDHLQADGSTKERLRISSVNYKMLSFLQSIAVCRGYRANVKPCKDRGNPKHQILYRFSLSKRSTHFLTKHKFQFEQIWLPERVWCVTSESGNIITRRKGTVTITGNTTGADFPELDCIINLRPTRSMALWVQMMGRAVRIAPGKEFATIIDWTNTINQLGKIETVELRKEQFPEFQAPMWEIFSQTQNGEERWHNRPLYSFKVKKGGKSDFVHKAMAAKAAKDERLF